MKSINTKYILVKKLEEEKKEGFQTVDVQDNFVYKGEVVRTPERPIYLDNMDLRVGDRILFKKYSPDTHEVMENGETMKMILVEDVLAII